ncbi:hypothetical protein [Streptomyces sp. NPDC048419]|uniref:hypothetical protein n=1 Tax=Streptomyces sp. NPDC048419 TaxID=3365547 RepID=UPI00371F3C30
MSKQQLAVIGRDAGCCPGLTAAPLAEDRATGLARVFKALGEEVFGHVEERGQFGRFVDVQQAPVTVVDAEGHQSVPQVLVEQDDGRPEGRIRVVRAVLRQFAPHLLAG